MSKRIEDYNEAIASQRYVAGDLVSYEEQAIIPFTRRPTIVSKTTGGYTVKSFFADAPVSEKAVLPKGYAFSDVPNHGVLVENKDEKKSEVEYTTVLPFPIVITKIFEGEFGKSNEFVEFAFHEPLSKRWKFFTVPREVLSKGSTVTVINNYGYKIRYDRDEKQTQKLLQYLDKYEEVNYYNIPRVKMTPKLGFDDDMSLFGLYSTEVTVMAEGDEEKILLDKGYVSKGKDIEDYVRGIKDILKDYSIPIFIYALSYASALLKVIKAPSFSVELCKHSGHCKSVCQKLAIGVWGNPAQLLRAWDATKVGIEMWLDFADSIPVVLEDAHNFLDEKELNKIFYMVSGTVGKLRGSTKGMRRTPKFQGILISSTETESTSRLNLDGIRRRLLELIEAPFPSKDIAIDSGKQTDRLHENFHGLAGKKWIEFLFEHKPVWRTFQQNYEEAVEELDFLLKNESYAQIDINTMRDQNRMLGVVATTIPLINDCFGFNFKVGTVIDEIKRAMYGTIAGNSKPIVALKKIIMWAIINEDAHFTLHTRTGKRHGFIRANKYIGIFEDSVKYFLKENGFNMSVMDEWKAMGIRMFEKDGRDYRVAIDSKNRHEMITFRWSELSRHLGEGFYQQDE